jgi:competence protein ComFC
MNKNRNIVFKKINLNFNFLKIRLFLEDFLDIFSTKECVFCSNKNKASFFQSIYICYDCLEKIYFFKNKNYVCSFCNHPLDKGNIKTSEENENFKITCQYCKNLFIASNEPFFVRNISIFPLYKEWKENIIKIKYYKDYINLKNLINFSLNLIQDNEEIINIINSSHFILYVPLSFRKKILRRYSISDIFAKKISNKFSKKTLNIFYEKGLKFTHLNKENRFQIEDNRYFINKNEINKLIKITNNLNLDNLNILLIDDIFTTGTTLNYLSKILINYLNENKNRLKSNLTISIYTLTLFRTI